MKKWILRIAFLLIIISVAGFFFAKSYVTRDYLVAAIEKSIDSRIQVKDIDVNLYGFSGTVNLDEVIIAQRDDVASKKIPHDERDPIVKGDIHLKSASFNISIWEILSKKILVEEINVDGVKVNLTLFENGDTSIEKLFAKPDRVKREKTKKFNAKENEKFIATINEVNLTNIDFNLIVEKTQLEIKGRGFNVNLLDINVNPKKLDTVNNAKIKINGMVDVLSLESNEDYGKIVTSGESDLTLFNTDNGDLEPDMILSLTVGSESYFTSKIPVIRKVCKAADVLKKFGINALVIPDKATFKTDQSIKASYKLGVITLIDPVDIEINDWELEAVSDSWVGSGNDTHKIGVKLHVGGSISKKLNGFLGKSKKAYNLVGKLTGGGGINSWLENGKITLQIESSGALSSPKIRVKNQLAKPAEDLIDGLLGGSEDKKGSLKEAGKDLLKGFLK